MSNLGMIVAQIIIESEMRRGAASTVAIFKRFKKENEAYRNKLAEQKKVEE